MSENHSTESSWLTAAKSIDAARQAVRRVIAEVEQAAAETDRPSDALNLARRVEQGMRDGLICLERARESHARSEGLRRGPDGSQEVVARMARVNAAEKPPSGRGTVLAKFSVS